MTAELAEARQRILDEEVREVAEAAQGGNSVETAQELADVVYGKAISYGVDAVIAEIHRANITKLGADGRPMSEMARCRKVNCTGRRTLLVCSIAKLLRRGQPSK